MLFAKSAAMFIRRIENNFMIDHRGIDGDTEEIMNSGPPAMISIISSVMFFNEAKNKSQYIMDPVSIVEISLLVILTVERIFKYTFVRIKRSTCCGATIETKDEDEAAV